MRKRRGLSQIILAAVVVSLMFFGISSAYAQDVQKAILSANPTNVGAINDPVAVTVAYDATDKTVTLFGATIHYNSSMLTYVDTTILHTDAAQAVQERAEEAAEDDGDANTDRVIIVAYNDIFTGADWPGESVTLPLNLATVNFTAKAEGATSVNVSGKTAGGFTFEDTPAAINIGVIVIEPIAQTIAEADGTLWLTPNLVIIDVADAAAYAAGRITGAQALADVDLASIPQETPILVYCRDAANAKAEADKLVAAPNSFTNVYYLDDIFENWVAAVNPVKVEYKLTLTIAGSGNGTVVDPVGNQYAPEDWYVKGTTVNLTGKPEAGSIFDGFSNGATGTDPVDVVMNASTDVTATFSPDGTCDAAPVITATPRTGAESLTVDFDSVGSTGTNPTWDYGDGQQFQGATATHTYAAADTYTVKLTTTGTGGCQDFATKDVTVIAPPPVCDLTTAPVINGATGGTEPLNVTLSAMVTGTADTYAWTVTKDGVSFQTGSASTLNLTALAAGTYTANLTVSNSEIANCSFAATPVTITVTAVNCDLVSATINPSTSGGEAPLNVNLSATVNGTADTYAWTVTKDGVSFQTGSASILNLTALAAGNYTVYLTVSNSAIQNCSLEAATVPIQVSPAGDCTKIGDGNNDGDVDIFDALLAAIYAVGNPDGIVIECLDMLDVYEEDAGVTATDALKIAMYDVRLGPCECSLDPY